MNERRYRPRNAALKLQYRGIAAYCGMTFAMIGATMLFPLVVLPAWPSEMCHAVHFILPASLMMGIGVLLYRRNKAHLAVLTLQDSSLIVVLSWGVACLVGTWPLVAIERLTVTQALFESVSGWTTTGLSVVDVASAHHLTLLWRSTMQAVGGAGFAVIMVAAIAGPIGTGLPAAEGRSEQLIPQVRESAKLVLLIYCSYLLVGTLGLAIVGMNWFDALNHAFAAVSTGGFSTRPESIGHWNSVAVEAVTIPLMILGNLNFLTAYLLCRGRLRAVSRDGEVRMITVIIPAVAMLLFLLLTYGLYPTLGKSVRVAVFEAVTCVTTTGFSTVSYTNWNSFGILVLIVLMIIGGGTGSTAGGIKQYRIFLMAKSVYWEVRRAMLPASAVVENSTWHAGERDYISDARIRQTATFVFLYMLILAGGTAILAAHGFSLPEALFEFASAQGTVGLSLGITSPQSPVIVLWAETIGMFLGRLEFLIVFVAVTKLCRDSRVLLTGCER